MKLEEYQDYVKLLFDKYLKRLIYALQPIIFIGTIIALSLPMNANEKIWIIIIPPIMLSVSLFIGFIVLRWALLVLPGKFFNAKKHVSDNIKSIHDKHNDV